MIETTKRCARVLTLVALLGLGLGLTGCKSSEPSDAGDHPTSGQPEGDHPKSEGDHPGDPEHPDHPAGEGEHPEGDRPASRPSDDD